MTCVHRSLNELANIGPSGWSAGVSIGTSCALPMMPTTVQPPLNQQDYPLVVFWRKSDFTKARKNSDGLSDLSMRRPQRGGARAARGENVAMRYVELDDGTVVDGYRATAIRDKARSIWYELVRKGRDPDTWMKVDNETGTAYKREMEDAFPELRLCELNWKAQQIAIDNYPNFDRKAAAAAIAMKTESGEPTLVLSSSKKRGRTYKHDRMDATKIQKLDEDDNNTIDI
jgi:hypothetical protein